MAQHIVQLVADYGPVGDLAWSEVETALYLHGPEGLVVVKTPVPKFNVIAASFVAFQLTHVPAKYAHRVIVFVNVDARIHTRERITDGDGAPFFIGTDVNGVRIAGPGLATFMAAGGLRSLVQVKIERFTVGRPGQFRSRDTYAQLVVQEILRRELIPADNVDRKLIPPLPQCVGIVDGYGNIKTTLRRDDVPEKQSLMCTMNGVMRKVHRVPGLFALAPGELGFYPGSSGLSGPESDRFLFYELAVRYDPTSEDPDDSAAKRFNYPAPGTPIFLESME